MCSNSKEVPGSVVSGSLDPYLHILDLVPTLFFRFSFVRMWSSESWTRFWLEEIASRLTSVFIDNFYWACDSHPNIFSHTATHSRWYSSLTPLRHNSEYSRHPWVRICPCPRWVTDKPLLLGHRWVTVNSAESWYTLLSHCWHRWITADSNHCWRSWVALDTAE